MNESLEDVGYERISENDFFSEMCWDDFEWELDKLVDFTQEQYHEIQRLFPNYSSRLGYSQKYGKYSNGFIIFKTKPMYGPFDDTSNFNHTAFYVIQTDDEWFWVSWWLDKNKKEGELRFFKCDQFSGLMNLLRDLKNEK